MKPASESRGRLTTSGPKSVTSKSSHCTPRCLHSSSRGSSSHPHPINQMAPSEGRYNCLAVTKNTEREEVDVGSLREKRSERQNEWSWCRKARWGIRWVKEESWKVGTETYFFPFLSFSAELTHTTYAAFVSMWFSALNYNWGITHALWAWGKYCILSHFYLSTTFAQALLLGAEAQDLGRLQPRERCTFKRADQKLDKSSSSWIT